MVESDILYQIGSFWVYFDKKHKAFMVCRPHGLISITDSGYANIEMAKYRADYLATRSPESKIGTNYFRRIESAIRYYESFGFSEESVQEKIRDSEIRIGRPARADGTMIECDREGRYHILYGGPFDGKKPAVRSKV